MFNQSSSFDDWEKNRKHIMDKWEKNKKHMMDEWEKNLKNMDFDNPNRDEPEDYLSFTPIWKKSYFD